MAFTYILECADGTLYTGWTTDLEQRVATHNRGRGAKYTRSRLPVRLVYAEEYAEPAHARKREYTLRNLPRQTKLALAAAYARSAESPQLNRPDEEGRESETT